MDPKPNHAVIDREEGLRRCGGDEALYRDLVRVFLGDLPRMLRELDDAIARQAVASIRRASHTLCGSASQIGAREAADCAGAIEQMAKANELQAVPETRRTLAASLETLKLTLETNPLSPGAKEADR